MHECPNCGEECGCPMAEEYGITSCGHCEDFDEDEAEWDEGQEIAA